MANEVASKGITLGYKVDSDSTYTELTNLSEIPELGGDVEAIEVTNLGDGAHRYIDGIKNYGDSLAFKFYYEKSQFTTLNGLAGQNVSWQVKLPDGTACTFGGGCSVKLDGIGVNAALTYTLSIKPNSEMAWA